MTRAIREAIFLIVSACIIGLTGCAGSRTHVPRQSAASAAPIPLVAQARTPAELSLDEVLPPAVLPAPAPASRPASQPATPPSTNPAAPQRPPLEALTLYAEACDNLLKHRRLAAVTLLEKAIALDPDSFELHFALGRAYLGSGGSDERSVAEMGRAAEIDPDHVELQTDLGRQYLVRGDADKALWHLRLALVTSDYPSKEAEAAVAELFAGRALARAGYHAAAVEVFDRLADRLRTPGFALRGDPEVAYLLAHPELLRLQAAESYEKVGRYEEALRAYDDAARRDPGDFGLRSRGVRMLLALRRYDEAIARAADAVARSGAEPASLDLLRDACRTAGRKGAAAEELRRLRRQRPRDTAIVFALADVLRSDGKPAEALDLLWPLVDARPPRAEAVRRMYECVLDLDATGRSAARFLIGWSARHPDAVHMVSDPWDDLIRPTRNPRVRLATLRELGPENSSAIDKGQWEAAKWFWVAQVARLRHRQEVARDALRRATGGEVVFAPAFRVASGSAGAGADDPADADAAAGDDDSGTEELAARAERMGDRALTAELRGLALLNRKQYADARKRFDEAAKLGGASPDLHFARAIAARGAGDDAAFEAILWKLASDWPHYANAYEALYTYHAARSADGPAAKALAEWLAADRSSVTARLLQVREHFRTGLAVAGERLLEQLIDERGDSPPVLAAARSYYTQFGKVDTFAAKLRQRLESSPANIAAAAQLADLLVDQRKLPEASRVLDAARAAVADDADLLYEVAHLYDRVGQKPMTEQVLGDVLRLDPDHASAANDLGYTLADAGRELDRAETLTRRAVAADPSNASYLDSLGWVLYKRGRFEEAGRTLARAVELSGIRGGEADPVVLDHLGDVLYRAGDAPAASQRWRQSMQRLAKTPGAAARDDFKALRLQLERKLKQAGAGQPVSVAPVAGQDAASEPLGATETN